MDWGMNGCLTEEDMTELAVLMTASLAWMSDRSNVAEVDEVRLPVDSRVTRDRQEQSFAS